MNLKKTIHLIVFLFSTTLSIYFFKWLMIDYSELIKINNHLKTWKSMTNQELIYHEGREKTHRINIAMEGTWTLMAGFVAYYALTHVIQKNKLEDKNK